MTVGRDIARNPITGSISGVKAWLAFAMGLIASAAAGEEQGVAAGYPGDVGIEQDKRVVFVENFEADSLDKLCENWETATGRKGMSFSKDLPAGSGGKQSLIMERERGSGSHLYRRLKNSTRTQGFEKLFARYYVKFAEDCG